MCNMTKEQKFMTDNHGLIGEYLKINGLDEREYYDVIVFGFMKAATHFLCSGEREDMSFREIAFREMTRCLQQNAQEIEYENVVLLADCHQAFTDEISRFLEDYDFESKLSSLLDETEKAMAELLMAGLPIREAAQELGVTVKQAITLKAKVERKAQGILVGAA